MEALKFQADQHYAEFCGWHSGHGKSAPPVDMLSMNGRIVPGFCAMFLYLTDSSIGLIENLVVNPDLKISDAEAALDCCFDAIEADAVRLSRRALFGFSYIPGVGERSKRWGFQPAKEKYRLMTKELVWGL